MKQDESQGCLKLSYVLGPALWTLTREGGCSEEGAKRDKNISDKNHPRNHQHTVKYFINPHFQQMIMS